MHHTTIKRLFHYCLHAEELVATIARCITPELQKRQKIAQEQPNEEGWPHTPTEGRKMTIDEQVMVSKEIKANEDATQLQKNELMSAFVKRNLKKDQPPSIGGEAGGGGVCVCVWGGGEVGGGEEGGN